MLDGTRKFSLVDESNKEILSEDPTYITNHNNARSLICKIDRDELMQELVQFYLDN